MKLTRILKAVLGTAVTWGAVWSLLSIPTLAHLLTMPDTPVPSSDTTAHLVALWAQVWLTAFAQGAVFGIGFGVLLHLASRRLRFLQRLSFAGVGIVGAVAPAAIAVVVIGPVIGIVGGLILAGMGAATALLSLSVARRSRERSLSTPESVTQLPAP